MSFLNNEIKLCYQGCNEQTINAEILHIRNNGYLTVCREDGYKMNIRNRNRRIFNSSKPICREKTRKVFEIVRDTLMESENSDQDLLLAGKLMGVVIENYF